MSTVSKNHRCDQPFAPALRVTPPIVKYANPRQNGGVSYANVTSQQASLVEFMRRDASGLDSRLESDYLFGDVRINFSTMEASRSDEPETLTALQFKTLKYLIRNPRRVISRNELLDEVWGYQSYPSTRTVDNQVAQLRKKLERNRSRPVHLRTVHGVGYKFVP